MAEDAVSGAEATAEGDMVVEEDIADAEAMKDEKIPAAIEMDISGEIAPDSAAVEARGSATAAVASAPPRDGVAEWDSKKYHNIASIKYSKDRHVGSASDNVFVFGQAAAASVVSAEESP